MKKLLYIVALLLICASANSAFAKALKGKVFGYDINQKKAPLQGVTVQWEDTKIGTKTDKNGDFTIERTPKSKKLNVSYIGYKKLSQEIDDNAGNIQIQLELSQTDNVTVIGQQSAIVLSESAINTQQITLTGLRKAACCNLSESFIANPSVDVNYSDAVTGAKQIELLGLEGTYTQMMTENIPNLRGLATTYGLNYVPGQWMESIQISKGAASVTSGYESITGQINVEYKKPHGTDPLFINLYGSQEGRFEGDITSAIPVAEGLGTNIFVHANYNNHQMDENDDKFLDSPLEEQYAFLNRWEYEGDGFHTNHTIKVLSETRKSGQMDYFPDLDQSKYGVKIKTERYELYGKAGYVLPTESYNSLAFMYSVSTHDQKSNFGKNNYSGNQKSFFTKLLFETRWGKKEHVHTADCDHEAEAEEESHEGHNHEAEAAEESHEGHNHEAEVTEESHEGHNHEAEVAEESHEGHNHEAEETSAHSGHSEEATDIHKINMGVSFNFDQFDESYKYKLNGLDSYGDTLINKIERIPGAFAEYTYSGIDNLAIIGGLRMDFHNIYGNFFTPRVHIKYQPVTEFTIRTSAGKGYHINNIFAENSGIMASSRNLIIDEQLNPEEAWNFGVSTTTLFNMFGMDFTLNADYYRTDFINQVMVDMERNPNEVHFYNLKGDSYSNSYQVDLTFAPIHRFDIMLAYRYNDVKMTYDGKLTEKPLTSRFKAFINLAYATDFDEWKFDFTAVLNGGGTMPNTEKNPVEYRLDKEFDPYFTLHAQITKKFGDLEIYLGGENLTNFKQKNPILGASDPFGQFFDSSMIWGPIMGRKLYAGIRLNVL